MTPSQRNLQPPVLSACARSLEQPDSWSRSRGWGWGWGARGAGAERTQVQVAALRGWPRHAVRTVTLPSVETAEVSAFTWYVISRSF